MDLDPDAAPDPRIALALPLVGIREVLRGYSGEGSIYEDLAASSVQGLDWTSTDIRRRARRVLLAMIEPLYDGWPHTVREWRDHLPAATVATRKDTRVPDSGTAWSETRRRHGWPPRAFAGRARRRTADEVSLRTLAWVADELRTTAGIVGALAPAAVSEATWWADLLAEVLEAWPDVEPLQPDRTDLGALAGSGHPWRTVALAAERLVRASRDPEFIAFDLIAPDPDGAARLFHLGVYGLVIRALANHRFLITWRRPISGNRPGAQIEAIGPSGSRFELWFEAAAARTAYGLGPSAYQGAVAGISGAGGAIGADVMLIDPSKRALLLECKYSLSATYVGRDGFHQAASYALDSINGVADQAWSFVVGPQEVVADPAVSVLAPPLDIVLGSVSPLHIGDLVAAFLTDDPLSLG